MRAKRVRDEDWICSINARCSGKSGLSATSCARPSTALSGVRISCDMVARNCDLASFAAWTWRRARIMLAEKWVRSPCFLRPKEQWLQGAVLYSFAQ